MRIRELLKQTEKLLKQKITGEKIDLDKLGLKKKPSYTSSGDLKEQKKKRKRITNKVSANKFNNDRRKSNKQIVEISPEELQKKIRETLAEVARWR